ncbi:manganese transporter [bacterium]|nr:manganese transporter [bacterium]
MHLGSLFRLLLICTLAAGILTGCQTQQNSSSTKINVVATTGMLADLTTNICGEHCEVTPLMGPGVDPHLYKPTAGDLEKIQSADLVVYGGLHLEGRMTDILESLGEKSFSAGEAIPKNLILSTGGQSDPHIWHDPTLWQEVGTALAKKLTDMRGKSISMHVVNNWKAYQSELKELDAETRKSLNSIPEDSRVLITAHDAFEYYGKRYNLQVLGIQGTNTVTEASAQTIVQLADTIASKKIKAIFVETSVNPATIRALQKAVQDRNWEVKIGGELFSDALGANGTPEATYIGMIRHNTNTIANALK